MNVEREPSLGRLLEIAPENVTGVTPERTAVGCVNVAEHPGDSPLSLVPAPRHDLKGACIRAREHVRFLNAGEAFNRGTIESYAFIEGRLEFFGGDREGLEEAENVGEPQPHEANAALLNRAQHVILLSFHAGKNTPRLFRSRFHAGEG